MVVTEIEATQKWCPQARIGDGGYNAIAEPLKGNHTTRCVGSSCMMWRWDTTRKCIQEQSISRASYRPSLYVDLPKEQWTGYCGMGGKP